MSREPLPEGWYSGEELRLLEATARHHTGSPFAVVEIGVHKGRSARVLARHTSHLVLVDDLSMGDFRRQWPAHEYEFLSVEAAAANVNSVVFLHQDAGHDFLTVLAHLQLFLPKLVPEATVCLHDFHSSTYPGVKKAWQWAAQGQDWREVGHEETLVCFRRRS